MQAVTSMTKCYHLRALALLGALILFFFLWPIYCCSARPTGRLLMNTPNTNSQRSRILNQKNDEHESISSIEHQNYEEFLKITGVSDKVDRKREIVNFLNSGENNLKATYDNDKGTIKDNGNENMYSNNLSLNQQTLIENVAETFLTNSETMTTSVYELFYLKNKSKPESSNQILSRTNRSVHLNSSNNRNNSVSGAKRVKNNKEKLSTLDRNERSANLSHISGSARKIQLYIKNRFLQLLADGTVNGTTDDMSDFTILQRTTVNVGQIKIQGVATCLYLCMNSCGAIYGSAEFTDDCVFNESMEQHHYNTYSSTYHSNAKRKLYLGLNRHGQPRKIQLPATRPLGKLSIYTKTLTKTVAQAQVEALIARLFGPNRVKHGLKQLCDTGNVLQNIIAKGLKAKPKCNSSVKPNRKKKRKRKCRIDEPEGVECLKETSSSISQYHNNTKPNNSINNFNNKRKSTSGNQNQHQRKCITNDDCGSQKGNRKKPPFIKKNNQIKFSLSSNSNSNHKPKSRKKLTKTSTKSTTTTSTPDDIDQDVDKDEAFTSDELEDEDYDDVNLSAAGHSINLIDDHMIDDYNN